MPGSCNFTVAWVGQCKKPAELHDHTKTPTQYRCKKHDALCGVCKEKLAYKDCGETWGPMCCGQFLCDTCKCNCVTRRQRMNERYTRDHMDAALCIWEYCMQRRAEGSDDVYDWMRGGEGAASARDMAIDLAKDCDESYQRAHTLGFDDSFDWEFVPRWVELAMEISKKHDLVGHWIEYMGMEIYRDHERTHAL